MVQYYPHITATQEQKTGVNNSGFLDDFMAKVRLK